MDRIAAHRTTRASVCLLVALASPMAAQASGARQGVKALPGEIVLLRDVPARPAYRPAPPGMALIADPSPKREVGQALGTATGLDELSDADYAALGANPGAGAGHVPTSIERATGTNVNATLGKANDNGMLSGGQLSNAIGGPMGAVSGATRGIGDQVRGALAQFPLGAAAGGPGK
ncbi:hypothetical protein [Stenotrophomonas rhizophila]|uniref:hypothetical protein n=1 Tax=Stenotrophomonas rhizophila TaxID=216778 RepID=UPI001E5B553F|nr:hypothetical protein [Stenotrophomonas rhizophila]MCC7632814.1 hypothetical protein [Stenotrophomonas rhizophila]MCC7662461.1 hypothetical protein [Stenotrophomonas rhizophila]